MKLIVPSLCSSYVRYTRGFNRDDRNTAKFYSDTPDTMELLWQSPRFADQSLINHSSILVPEFVICYWAITGKWSRIHSRYTVHKFHNCFFFNGNTISAINQKVNVISRKLFRRGTLSQTATSISIFLRRIKPKYKLEQFVKSTNYNSCIVKQTKDYICNVIRSFLTYLRLA